MKRITSPHNESFKLAKKIGTSRGSRKEDAFLIEGGKLLVEAIAGGLEIITIFVRHEDVKLPEELTEELQSEAMILDEKLFSELTDTVSPQGIVAIVRRPSGEGKTICAVGRKAADDKGKDTKDLRVIILDRLSDPGNVGTVIRTALAAEFDMAVLVKGTAEVYSDKVIRSSAGAVFHLPIAFAGSAQECVDDIRKLGLRLMTCHIDGLDIYSEANIAGGVAFAVGNEANGPSKGFSENSDEVLTIPMDSRSESLNVGVAAAVVMFEKYRIDHS
ncbi:MAG: RNA methyltransferase [Clostridiales Family XIII bacterium]|jgi:TrmH family RNA methyltransferase|nr:RNA methyltransferase [Clostridiales Family XIII bacterium]